MPSKSVTDRQKSTRSVNAAIKTHANAIHERFADLVAPVLAEGEQVPDMRHLLDVLGRLLTLRVEAMVEADEAHIQELGDDAPARAVRDEVAEDLRAFVVELRQVLEGLYGPRFNARLNISGSTPEDPVVLIRFAGEMAKGLRDTPLPESRIPSASIDKAQTAQALDDKAEALDTALDKVALESREAETTQSAKDRAITANDLTFLHAARELEAIARLVELPDLADRVRPSVRRPGLTEDDELDITPTDD